MRLSTKLTGIVALGGAAALAAGLISSGGIGASFSDSATATADIRVGTFACNFDPSASSNDWTITTNPDNTQSATISFDQIKSSAAGSKTAPLVLKNDGSIDAYVSWAAAPIADIPPAPILPSEFTATQPPADGVLAAGASETADLGFQWDVLENSALGTAGSLTYTATCDEVQIMPSGLKLEASGTTSATWDARTGNVVLTRDADTTTPYRSRVYFAAPAGTTIADLPHAPSFTTDYYGGGTPRILLTVKKTGTFGATKIIWGYPAQGSYLWEYSGGSPVSGPMTWDAMKASLASNSYVTVTQFEVNLDWAPAGTAVTANISCMQLNDIHYLGSSC